MMRIILLDNKKYPITRCVPSLIDGSTNLQPSYLTPVLDLAILRKGTKRSPQPICTFWVTPPPPKV